MADGATVPLFYEKRVPKVLIQNEGLSEEFYAILEEENLDEAQQARLEQKFAQEIEDIKRDDRLETIARDIVYHFPRRGYLGKGMVISLDKFTAVKMYDKVQRLWKAELLRLLDAAIAQGLDFCRERGIDLAALLEDGDTFKHIGRFEQYADTLLGNEEWRKAFNVYENTVTSLYQACKPEVLGLGKSRTVAAFQYLRGVVDSIVEPVGVAAANLRIAELLDESVVVDNGEKFAVQEPTGEYRAIKKSKVWDLSRIDFDKLKEDFRQAAYKNIEIADLRAFIQHKLAQMLQQNLTRTDFAQRLQRIIDTYNAGGSATENYFDDLMSFAKDLRGEDERHIREGLSEDELELFDLLKKERMSQDETRQVKLAAKHLLHRLLEERPKVLVQDWHRDAQSQRVVRNAVEQVLDQDLPESYGRILFKEKCDRVFEAMLDYAASGRKWAA